MPAPVKGVLRGVPFESEVLRHTYIVVTRTTKRQSGLTSVRRPAPRFDKPVLHAAEIPLAAPARRAHRAQRRAQDRRVLPPAAEAALSWEAPARRLSERGVLVRRESSLLRLLFVGITRATSWVHFSAVEGDELPVLHALAANAPEVVVQRYAAHGADCPRTERSACPACGRPMAFVLCRSCRAALPPP